MGLNAALVDHCSAQLWSAECSRSPIGLLSVAHPQLSEDDAYAISAATLQRRGAKAVGFKLGYTSAAMRAQMGIAHPNYGVLTEQHRIGIDGGSIDHSRLIHPRVEPEIALRLARDLSGAGHARESVARHLDAVLPALEIVDTRYPDYRFTAVDNIADNSSSAGFVTGAPMRWRDDLDLRPVEVVLHADGQRLDRGLGAAAMEDPLLALAWLAGCLAARGGSVPAGAIVLTGGLTRAYAARAGQAFLAEFSGLGTVRVRFD